jgi:hypothetical protein
LISGDKDIGGFRSHPNSITTESSQKPTDEQDMNHDEMIFANRGNGFDWHCSPEKLSW